MIKAITTLIIIFSLTSIGVANPKHTKISPAQSVQKSVSKGVGKVNSAKIKSSKPIPVVCTTYSTYFNNRRTASGVRYRHNGYVIASRGGASGFRMGTRLAVKRGDKCVIVVVGDRGGLPHGTKLRKPLDLSGAATRALGLKPGVHKATCYILP